MEQNVEKAETAGTASAADASAALTASRFLFVDVSAQRAKQLRRGALPRLARASPGSGPYKLERIAMEEVRQGAIDYTLPTLPEPDSRSETA